MYKQSAVVLDKVISLAEEDLGIEGAVIDPSGEKVIVYGADTYLELLDSSNPSERIELVWNDDIDLHAGDFHPGGQTALIVGDNGEVLRYALSDHSITDAGGDLDFGNVELILCGLESWWFLGLYWWPRRLVVEDEGCGGWRCGSPPSCGTRE